MVTSRIVANEHLYTVRNLRTYTLRVIKTAYHYQLETWRRNLLSCIHHYEDVRESIFAASTRKSDGTNLVQFSHIPPERPFTLLLAH